MRTFYTLLILPVSLHAQQPAGDSSSSIDRGPLVSIVQKQLGNNLRLFTGAEYIRNGQHAQGHPFFQSDQPMDGSLWYDGARYDHAALQFDLITGDVVVSDTIGNASISLIKEKLPRFSLSGHHFIWLPMAGDSDRSISPGYYELLEDGSTPLVARHEKRLRFPTTKEDIVKYVSIDSYFIRIDSRYIRVEGRRGLLNILSDKKDALKKFIRQHDLDFSKDLETSLQQVIHYYTQLKN
ncbi:MAG TPA: hypothetical protein VHD83_26725 [Puia sp.]|nr:hypothetical protein [Puia sp.]